jgi:hypothetical protein
MSLAGLTWTCNVCGKERPDAQISVASAVEQFGAGAEMITNTRYCNDNPVCARMAPLLASNVLEKTDERVMEIGTRLTKAGAERLRTSHPPLVPSYHCRVEKQGFLRWAVVAYQNRLVPR